MSEYRAPNGWVIFDLNEALSRPLPGRTEVKCKVVPVHAIKAYMRSRGIAPLIVNLGTR